MVPRDGAAGDGANVSGASAWSTDTGDVGGSALTARLRSLSDQGRSPGSAAAAGAPGGPSVGDAMAAAGHGPAGPAPLPVRGVGGPSVGDAAVAAGHGPAGPAPLPVRGVGGPSVGDAMAAAGHGPAGPAPLPVRGVGGPSVGDAAAAAGHGAAGPAPLPVRGVGGPSAGDAMAAAGHGAAGPAPLPVRGARHERPNPAEAVPGIRRAERAVVEENAGLAPVPRNGPVRGTMGKPQLPRRRAQEHIAPQLRGGPAPRPDAEQPAAHDPGLMAAFQRGIGLAEAQQSLEAEVLESAVPFPEWEPLQHGSYQASDPVAPPDSRPPAAPPAPGPAHPRHPAARTAPGSPLRMTDGAGAPQGPGSGSEQPNPRHDGSAPAG
ncbi:hypothetical protein [Streptomyces sp. NBC_00582]|uniref:hypothetical protein n=1 Tax=Streptomyces sp. NBC_00582 TaxID=2975783 RepID=UPI003FCEBB56